MEGIPRGAIYNDAGDVLGDRPDNYTAGILNWRDAAYEEAHKTAAMSQEAPRIQKYIDFIEGNQIDSRRPRYKSQFYLNKVGKARLDSLSLLTDTKPIVEVYSKDESLNDKASMIDRVIRAEWMNNDMDLSLITVADIAEVTGTSFLKIGAARPGMMRVLPCGPDMVLPIQPGFHLQQSTAVLYKTYKSLAEVVNKFPMRSQDLERESVHHFSRTSGNSYSRPDALDNHTWQALAPQMQRLIGKKVQAADHFDTGMFRSVEWQEYFIDDPARNQSNRTVIMRDPYMPLEQHNWWYKVKPGERLYPRKRLLIFAGRRVIYDGPAPFWHGLYPFACLRLNPVFWSFWGLSKYRDLVPVNSAINDIIGGILDSIKKALNQTVVAKGQSISPAAWKEFFPEAPGQKLYLQTASANPASDIRYIDPPNLPNYVFQVLAEFLNPEFDKLAGTVDIAALGKKMQVPGGDTLEQMRDSSQTAVKLEGRFMEAFLRDAGMQAVPNVIQFYDRAQRMRLIGPDGVTRDDFTYDPQDMIPESSDKFNYHKNFSFAVAAGSMHSGAKDRSKLMYMNLRKGRDISRRTLLEKLEVPDIEKNEQELSAEMQEMAALQQQGKGGGGEDPTAAVGQAIIRMTRGERNGEPPIS